MTEKTEELLVDSSQKAAIGEAQHLHYKYLGNHCAGVFVCYDVVAKKWQTAVREYYAVEVEWTYYRMYDRETAEAIVAAGYATEWMNALSWGDHEPSSHKQAPIASLPDEEDLHNLQLPRPSVDVGFADHERANIHYEPVGTVEVYINGELYNAAGPVLPFDLICWVADADPGTTSIYYKGGTSSDIGELYSDECVEVEEGLELRVVSKYA